MLKRITVIYNQTEKDGLESDEDTAKSAISVADNLQISGYQTELLELNKSNLNLLKNIQPDLVFNLIEWDGNNLSYALEGIEILENRKLPFTGSGRKGYRLTVDKNMMKKKFRQLGIRTPAWCLWPDQADISSLHFPVIVKLATTHCSVGISQASVVNDVRSAKILAENMFKKYREKVMIEEYVTGRELQITILEKNRRPWVLPFCEILFEKENKFIPILTYESKWKEEASDYKRSDITNIVDIRDDIKNRIVETAKICYTDMDGKDYPRLDLRFSDEGINVLEINNNPGIDFEDDSGIGLSAKAAGFKSFPELLKHIVENAYRRFI